MDPDPVSATLVMVGTIAAMVFIFVAKRRARRKGRPLWPRLDAMLWGNDPSEDGAVRGGSGDED